MRLLHLSKSSASRQQQYHQKDNLVQFLVADYLAKDSVSNYSCQYQVSNHYLRNL
jgi:hypothetical protein